MSELSFLEKLLDGVEVEWLPLGDVTRYEQPTKYLVTSSNYSSDFDTPVLTAGKTFILGYTDEVNDVYKASVSPVIIFVDLPTANRWVVLDFKAKSSAMKMITSSDEGQVILKYVYYWLNTLPSGLVEADHKRHWIGTFSNRKIPIPCPKDPRKSLDIQSKLVQILDTFSELTSELTSRKQQYNYYRDYLLSFPDGGAEWKPLGEIGEFIRGKRFTKDDFVEDGIQVIHYGEIYTRYGVWADQVFSHVRSDMAESLRYAEPGDVVMTGVGETVEDVGKAVAWVGHGRVAIHDDSYAFRHSMNPKFISYAMQTAVFIDEKAKHVS